MSVRPLVLVFLLLSITYSEKCIGSFKELEESVLSSDENMLNLVRAFYPANQHPALIVEVTYVVEDNDSISTTNTSIYVYRWVSSQVLIYSYPQFLQGLSLRTYSVVIYYANITVDPFCQDISSIEKIRLFNDATIWLKLYTTHRLSVIDHGADSSLQGYSSYKVNLEINDFAVFEKEDLYKIHIYTMAIAGISLFFACVIFASSTLDSSYDSLHKKSENLKKEENQIFRFKSLFWAVISTLFLVIMFVAILDIYEISNFGTSWNSTSISIYCLLIVGAISSLFVCGVISIVIVKRANKRKTLIYLPILLYRGQQISNQSQREDRRQQDSNQGHEEDGSLQDSNQSQGEDRRQQQSNQSQGEDTRQQQINESEGKGILFYQFIGCFTILLSSMAVSFHGTGIVIAALADPLQVISTVATFVVALFYLTYAFADMYDCYEDIFNVSNYRNNEYQSSNYKSKKSKVIFFILRVLTHAFIIILILFFSYTYLTAVIFIGGNNIGVISSIANVLPLILLSVLTWFSKNELQKFFKFESSSNSNDTTENSSLVETSF